MDVQAHFEGLAEEYDHWKRKNSYYYLNLKSLFRSLIPLQASVLEIGCGTGDILASLEPRRGLGVDISAKMIDLASRKHAADARLRFQVLDAASLRGIVDYEYIALADVLEHIPDLEAFFSHLAAICAPHTRLVISLANPFWEPLLMAAEKMGWKMPEGPHTRLTLTDNEAIFLRHRFRILDKGYRLLIPRQVPGADWINARFHRSMALRRLGFVVYWVLQPLG